MQKKVADCLAQYSGKKLAVGVSGGRDSMCLLHAVLHCGAVQKSDIIVVHVNHCLRDNADGDEKFVREYCSKNGVAFTCKRVNVNSHAAQNGLTIEQAARNMRYGVFFDIIKHGSAEVVLTAHHALDNAETVLMHLFRGAGLDGLCGMSSDRIVRPLLDVYPNELDEYARENEIKYVVDDTNFIDDADRNFIRLNVIPLIEKRYKGAVRAVNAFAAECESVCNYLDGAIDESLIGFDDGAVIIKDGALKAALGSRYVRRALEFFSLTDITREQIDRVVALANMRMGATIELSNSIAAAKEYGAVALYIARAKNDVEVPIKLGANFIDGLVVDIAASDIDPREAAGSAVDLDALSGAVLRFRRDGDVFTPFGGKQKKLKQYFIDNKVPKRKRDRIPLVCRGSEVLAVVGMQIADGVKQTKNTVHKGTVNVRW